MPTGGVEHSLLCLVGGYHSTKTYMSYCTNQIELWALKLGKVKSIVDTSILLSS